MTIYYATYRLPQGDWQETACFEDADEAKEAMHAHAQGRGYIISKTEEGVERMKHDFTPKGYIVCLLCDAKVQVEDISLSPDEVVGRAGWGRIFVGEEMIGYVCPKHLPKK